jgi:hypothetical protein
VTDPNADLVGWRVRHECGTMLTVTGTSPNAQYLNVESDDGRIRTLKQTAAVRELVARARAAGAR